MTRCLHLLDYRVYLSANLHTCVLRCECLRFITFLNHNLKKRNTARKLLRNHISRAVLLTVGTLETNLCPQMRFCDLAASLLKLHNVPRQVKKQMTNYQCLPGGELLNRCQDCSSQSRPVQQQVRTRLVCVFAKSVHFGVPISMHVQV